MISNIKCLYNCWPQKKKFGKNRLYWLCRVPMGDLTSFMHSSKHSCGINWGSVWCDPKESANCFMCPVAYLDIILYTSNLILCVRKFYRYVCLSIICVQCFSRQEASWGLSFRWLWATMFGLEFSWKATPLSPWTTFSAFIIWHKELVLATFLRLAGGMFYCVSISIAPKEFTCYN